MSESQTDFEDPRWNEKQTALDTFDRGDNSDA
jgi:hypothetical protein